MTIEVLTPIYRDEKATELNTLLKGLLDDLELENEGMNDYLMDLLLNHEKREEKSLHEILENSNDIQEIVEIKYRQDQLTDVIKRLKDIVYIGYNTTPVEDIKQPTPIRQKPMSRDECLIWLGTQVKPLILEGETSQKAIGEKLNIPANTISQRVTRVYSKLWAEYVELVNQGIY